MAKKEVYGPLMKPSEFRALPHEQQISRAKEFYGSAWRDRCDQSAAGGGAHHCQNPQEHEAALGYLRTEAEKHKAAGGYAARGSLLDRPDVQKAMSTHRKHQAPDLLGQIHEIGMPLSDFHGYTAGERNPNPWPAK